MTRMAGEELAGVVYSEDMFDVPSKELIEMGIKESLKTLSSPNASEEEQARAAIMLSELQNLAGKS